MVRGEMGAQECMQVFVNYFKTLIQNLRKN